MTKNQNFAQPFIDMDSTKCRQKAEEFIATLDPEQNENFESVKHDISVVVSNAGLISCGTALVLYNAPKQKPLPYSQQLTKA